MTDWYALKVRSGKELWSAKMLRRKGVRAAVPVRRSRSRIGRHLTLRPVIAGTVWVLLEAPVNWQAIFDLEIAYKIILADGLPAKLDGPSVEQMLTNKGAGVYADSLLWRKMKQRPEYVLKQALRAA